MSARTAILASMTRAHGGSDTLRRVLDLARPHKYIILSDHHKGAGDGADEFARCVPAYSRALARYRDDGFTLILLGDVEELWENRFSEVRARYEASLMREEAGFGPERYLRVRGNHDDAWAEPYLVSRDLRALMPAERVWEAIRFQVVEGDRWHGDLFLVHGHQGEFGSDVLSPLARLALRIVWRRAQNLFTLGRQTPAKDACLRGIHDRHLYAWAITQPKLLLIAGHTHRPVWSSRTHLQALEAQLQDLLDLAVSGRPAEFAARVAALEADIAERRRKYPPCEDSDSAAIPCYFNTGCCKFDDGDITGVEIDDGVLRLVKWGAEPAAAGAIVLEQDRLTDLFARIP